MTDQRERIIEAVADEIERSWLNGVETRPDATPFTAATVDTAMLGVCPVCHRQTPSWLHNPASGEFDILCNHPYHTARERMESAE